MISQRWLPYQTLSECYSCPWDLWFTGEWRQYSVAHSYSQFYPFLVPIIFSALSRYASKASDFHLPTGPVASSVCKRFSLFPRVVISMLCLCRCFPLPTVLDTCGGEVLLIVSASECSFLSTEDIRRRPASVLLSWAGDCRSLVHSFLNQVDALRSCCPLCTLRRYLS